MTSNRVGKVFIKCFQLIARARVEVFCGDGFRDLRVAMIRANRSELMLQTFSLGEFSANTTTV